MVASGLHTFLLTYKLFNRLGLLRESALAGLGFDELSFLKPVAPGDTLRVRVSVAALRESTRGDRGVVTLDLRTSNQRDEQVLKVRVSILVAKKER
jgi:acyl dehydratase